ncbi:hypothetical protein RCL_jg890.t1 [Rhizophagus clarus]|uniref:Integrase catalytic domain-containing protein n=1 Tax=Rhizophagus clarus TaxID=94130 RepID=A0A8H3R580_9GLOM|nr:hypothetical protein RCL_jg890.t1 [Rhizophagus clarus]
MPALLPLIPIIQIDSGEAQDLNVGIALQKIYYQPVGYQRNAKKLLEASIKTGYDFTLDEVNDWLERQTKAENKNTMGIVERYNRTLWERCGLSQDASDQLLPITERSRAWVKNLQLIVEDINNFLTKQIGMAPAVAIEKKSIIANPSYPRDGPVGFDEKKLSSDVLVRYLLYSSDQEGGRRRAGDLNWSPHIYYIHQSMVQKNQPVLY